MQKVASVNVFIFYSIPAPSKSQIDMLSAPSEFKPSIVPAPTGLRMDEKTAAEIAVLYAQDNTPQRSEHVEDSIPGIYKF